MTNSMLSPRAHAEVDHSGEEQDTMTDNFFFERMEGTVSDIELPNETAEESTASDTDVLPISDDSSANDDLVGKDIPPANNDFFGSAIDPNTSDDIPQADSETFEEQFFYKRELRPVREATRIAPRTWLDADTTGDFDPHEEARQLRARKKRPKIPHRGNLDWGNEGYSSEPRIELRPQTQPKPILCLSFSSSSGRAAFSELCANFEHAVKPARDHFTEGYQLRKRKRACDGNLLERIGLQTTGVRVLANEQPRDLQNQPAARGCFDCMAMGLNCSLLDNEHSWPCDDCKANDCDCHLVQEPELKLACTHCQNLGKIKKWLVCSFDYEQDPADHRGRCKRCQEDNHHNCVAGPRPGVTRTRIRIGADGEPYTNQPSTGQRTLQNSTCRQCLDSQRTCSFANGAAHGRGDVCTACDMSGDLCEPLGRKARMHRDRQPRRRASRMKLEELDSEHEIDTRANRSEGFDEDEFDGDQELIAWFDRAPIGPFDGQQSHGEPSADQDQDIITISSSSPGALVTGHLRRGYTSTSESSDEEPDASSCTVKIVRTKFCHPIRFEYLDTTPDNSDPCSFCSCAHYSIIGLEERTAEVIEWHDGRGWEEISGGHKGDNVKNTQVCSSCTIARMKVMVCEEHLMARISEVGQKRDFDAAFERLLLNEKTRGERWCTVCCSLVDWECCAEQRVEAKEGCGLALCEDCVSHLRKCGGSLAKMLTQLGDKATEERLNGLRADFELLKLDGLLMSFVNWSASA